MDAGITYDLASSAAVRGWITETFGEARHALGAFVARGLHPSQVYKMMEEGSTHNEATLSKFVNAIEEIEKERRSELVGGTILPSKVQPHPGDEGLSIDRSEVGDEVPEEAAG